MSWMGRGELVAVPCPCPGCKSLIHWTPLHPTTDCPRHVSKACDGGHRVILSFTTPSGPPTATCDVAQRSGPGSD